MPRIPNNPTNSTSRTKELDSKIIKRLENAFLRKHKKAGPFTLISSKLEEKNCFYVFASRKQILDLIKDDNFEGIQIIKKLKKVPDLGK